MMQRERYLDTAKGLGIWSIVFLHFENGVIPGGINTYLGAWMISIFYVIAGIIMFKRESQSDKGLTTKELLLKRLRQLGIPYAIWCGLILCFDCILWAFGWYDSYFVAREVYKALVLRGIGTLWFLPALLFGEVLWHYLKTKRLGFRVIGIIALIAYGYVYEHIFGGIESNLGKIVDAPFRTISSISWATICVAAGYCFNKFVWNKVEAKTQNNSDSWQVKLGFIAAGLAISATAYFCTNHLNLILGKAAPWLWKFFAPLLGPIGIITLCKGIHGWVMPYWGRNSLSLMITHYSITLVLCEMADKLLLHHTSFTGVSTILWFVAMIPVQYLITWAINNFAPELIGKKRLKIEK